MLFFGIQSTSMNRHMNMGTLAGWPCNFSVLSIPSLSCRNKMFLPWSTSIFVFVPYYTLFALVLLVQEGGLFFSHSHEKTKHFHLTFSCRVYFPRYIYMALCASVLPFSICRYFWLLFPLSTHLLLWLHVGVFCLSLFADGSGEGWRVWEIMERKEIQPVFACVGCHRGQT